MVPKTRSPYFFSLHRYCFQVIPTEFGVARPWHFIVTDPIKWLHRRTTKTAGLSTTRAVTKVCPRKKNEI